MAFTRAIYGKKYRYKSIRENGKVKSIYLGKVLKAKPKRSIANIILSMLLLFSSFLSLPLLNMFGIRVSYVLMSVIYLINSMTTFIAAFLILDSEMKKDG